VAYGGWLDLRHRTQYFPRLDGSIGVILGLFISSRAAAHLLDMILFGGKSRRFVLSRHGETLWAVLNVSVLILGCVVVAVGATQFTLAPGRP
jgi:hypothetical protein